MWWEQKGILEVINNQLYFSEQKVRRLAEQWGTPLYIYSLACISKNYQEIFDSMSIIWPQESKIFYAMKANRHPDILDKLKLLGGGIDVSSPGEVELGWQHGFGDLDIIFTGTSLSNRDIAFLAKTDILVNFDSISQLRRFPDEKKGRRIGLRINTGVGLGRSDFISTGGRMSGKIPVKFGIPAESILYALEQLRKKRFDIYCLHHHVGSDWLRNGLSDYFKALKKLIQIGEMIQERCNEVISMIDLGGGYGVPHTRSETKFPFTEFFEGAKSKIKESSLRPMIIAAEPGNHIVGNSGILVVEVNTVESKNGIRFVGVNAGLNVFNSASLYGIYHEIVNCDNVFGGEKECVTIVGNICETGDVFAVERNLPKIEEGNYLAILNAGAYGSVMSSEYNARPKAKEIAI